MLKTRVCVARFFRNEKNVTVIGFFLILATSDGTSDTSFC